MFAHPLFTLLVVIALVVAIAFTAEVTLSSANTMDRESKEQAHQEYELEEHFGEIRRYIVEEDIASLSHTCLNSMNALTCHSVNSPVVALCWNSDPAQYSKPDQ